MITLMTKDEIKDYTTDELIDLVNDLPVSAFGHREFEAFKNAASLTVSNNYPDSMAVIEIEATDGSTVELLYSDTNQPGLIPHFVG